MGVFAGKCCVPPRLCTQVHHRRNAPGLCLPPTIFSECFQGCSNPSPCSWTTFTPPGTSNFTGTNVQLGSDGANTSGLIFKSLMGVTPATITWRFTMTQIATAPYVGLAYLVASTDAAGIVQHLIIMGGDSVIALVTSGTDVRFGAWVPVNGATVTVHISVNGGTPSLFIDGVPVVLGAPGVIAPFLFFPNVAAIQVDDPALTGKATFDNYFITAGDFPPTASFCCPDGGPPP